MYSTTESSWSFCASITQRGRYATPFLPSFPPTIPILSWEAIIIDSIACAVCRPNLACWCCPISFTYADYLIITLHHQQSTHHYKSPSCKIANHQTDATYMPPLPSLSPPPIRPPPSNPNRSRLNITLRQDWLLGGGKSWRQWMIYIKDRSDAQSDMVTRHRSPPIPSPHQIHNDELNSWPIECYITARLATLGRKAGING